jgi:hypothetical protein
MRALPLVSKISGGKNCRYREMGKLDERATSQDGSTTTNKSSVSNILDVEVWSME